MKKKVKSRKASLRELLALCENFLEREEVKRDNNILGPLFMVYGTALEAEGKLEKAEQIMLKEKDLALTTLERDNQKNSSRSATSELAKIYQGRVEQAISSYKYLVENYSNVGVNTHGKTVKEPLVLFRLVLWEGYTNIIKGKMRGYCIFKRLPRSILIHLLHM